MSPVSVWNTLMVHQIITFAQSTQIGYNSTIMTTLYTHPDCSYSDALKSELDNKGQTYTEINLALNPEEWDTLVKLTAGERITPVLVNGEEVEIGFHGIG